MTKFMDAYLPLCVINAPRYATFFGSNFFNIHLLESPIKSKVLGFLRIALFTHTHMYIYIYIKSVSFCHYKRVPL